jgi:SpoIIAA-like
VPVEQLTEVPVGTLGFRITGHLRREDYTDVLLPPLRAAVRAHAEGGSGGDPIRVLVVIDPSFDGLEPSAVLQDLKAALDLGLAHRSAWRRFAVVSDADWVRRAVALFGWLTPGELQVFPAAELEAATAWVSEG